MPNSPVGHPHVVVGSSAWCAVSRPERVDKKLLATVNRYARWASPPRFVEVRPSQPKSIRGFISEIRVAEWHIRDKEGRMFEQEQAGQLPGWAEYLQRRFDLIEQIYRLVNAQVSQSAKPPQLSFNDDEREVSEDLLRGRISDLESSIKQLAALIADASPGIEEYLRRRLELTDHSCTLVERRVQQVRDTVGHWMLSHLEMTASSNGHQDVNRAFAAGRQQQVAAELRLEDCLHFDSNRDLSHMLGPEKLAHLMRLAEELMIEEACNTFYVPFEYRTTNDSPYDLTIGSLQSHISHLQRDRSDYHFKLGYGLLTPLPDCEDDPASRIYGRPLVWKDGRFQEPVHSPLSTDGETGTLHEKHTADAEIQATNLPTEIKGSRSRNVDKDTGSKALPNEQRTRHLVRAKRKAPQGKPPMRVIKSGTREAGKPSRCEKSKARQPPHREAQERIKSPRSAAGSASDRVLRRSERIRL